MLAAHSDTLPLTVVDDYADNVLAQQISQIAGVAQVTIGGEQKPAIRVQVDPAKLQARGLTLEDVRGVLVNATTNAAKGTHQRRAPELHDRRQRPAPQGGAIRRRHHRLPQRRAGARARRRPCGGGPQDVNVAAWSGDKPSVILLVFKQPGANVIETVDQIKAAHARLRAVIPPGMQVDTIIDRTQTIRASVARRRVHARAHHRPGRAGDPRCSCATCAPPSSRHRGAAVAARRRRR